jgi:hypothetical protein
MKQTGEQAAKEYAENLVTIIEDKRGYDFDKQSMRICLFSGDSMAEAFLAGCQHKEAEMVNKACRFAEFCGIYFIWISDNKWRPSALDPDYCSDCDYRTTAELYHSQAFSDWLKQFEE